METVRIIVTVVFIIVAIALSGIVLMQEGKTTVTVKDGVDFVVGSILKENGNGSNDIRVGDDATMDITGLVENLGNVKVDDDARLYILSGVSDANSEVSAEDADQDQNNDADRDQNDRQIAGKSHGTNGTAEEERARVAHKYLRRE